MKRKKIVGMILLIICFSVVPFAEVQNPRSSELSGAKNWIVGSSQATRSDMGFHLWQRAPQDRDGVENGS